MMYVSVCVCECMHVCTVRTKQPTKLSCTNRVRERESERAKRNYKEGGKKRVM